MSIIYQIIVLLVNRWYSYTVFTCTDPLPGAEKPSLYACSKLSVSNTIFNVTLRGGIKAGNFTDKGVVKNMDECAAFCCADERCNVAFLIRDNCFLVACKDYDSCKMKPALSEYYHPRLAYVNWSPPDDEIPGMIFFVREIRYNVKGRLHRRFLSHSSLRWKYAGVNWQWFQCNLAAIQVHYLLRFDAFPQNRRQVDKVSKTQRRRDNKTRGQNVAEISTSLHLGFSFRARVRQNCIKNANLHKEIARVLYFATQT